MDIFSKPPRNVTLQEKVNNLLHKGFRIDDIKSVIKTKEKLQDILPILKSDNIALK